MEIGQVETTLLHSYARGVGFRRWLLHPNCPPLLKACHDILNKAYNVSHAEKVTSDGHKRKEVPRDLAKILDRNDDRPVALLTRIEAQSGVYTIQGASGLGNSFVCMRLPGELGWRTGQIQYILDRGGGEIQFAIHQSLNLDLPGQDPFKGWWSGGFEAKLVSTSFLEATLVDRSCIIGHAARWNLWDGMCVAVNISQVRRISSSVQ